MNYTNKYDIKSRALIEALKYDNYDLEPLPNVYSATTLIDAPIQHILKKRFAGELTSDVSDNLWSVFGSCVHEVIERAGENMVKEQRFFLEIAEDDLKCIAYILPSGAKATEQEWYSEDKVYVAGKADIYDPESKTIEDVKVSGTYAFIYGKESWEKQLNIYAFAMRNIREVNHGKGYPVHFLRIEGICRDWEWRKSGGDDYPSCPLCEVEVPVWRNSQCLEYIRDRIRAFQVAEGFDNENLPPCSEEERWHRPGKLAVMKNKNVKASKLFDIGQEEEAQQWIRALDDQKNKYAVVERPGEDVRCCQLDYCKIKKWCKYWNDNHKEDR